MGQILSSMDIMEMEKGTLINVINPETMREYRMKVEKVVITGYDENKIPDLRIECVNTQNKQKYNIYPTGMIERDIEECEEHGIFPIECEYHHITLA